MQIFLIIFLLISSISFAKEMSCHTPDGGKHFIFIDKNGNESLWTQNDIDLVYKMNPHVQKYINMKNLADTVMRDVRKNHNKGNI